MKYLILFTCSLFLFSCADDDENTSTTELHHDGANFTAPFLDQGTHQACAKFTNTDLSRFDGQQITGVDAYFLNTPTLVSVNIYSGTTNNTPDNRIVNQDVSNEIDDQSWNSFELTNPVNIDGGDIWICMEVFHTSNIGSIGCDEGPAMTNGDWYNSVSQNTWQTFRALTNNEANINWNIRAIVTVL